MEQIPTTPQAILSRLIEIANGVNVPTDTDYSPEKAMQSKIDTDNAREGNLKYYDCPKCKNKGYVYKLIDGEEVGVLCDCHAKRENCKRIVDSGLEKVLETHSFDTYRAEEQWQMDYLKRAKKYAFNPDGKFFFIGGQTGCGKTHLCTAVCGALLHKGYTVYYAVWGKTMQKINSLSGNDDRIEREKALRPLLECDVLYLDDFLRNTNPSQAEIKLAFDIINERYNCEMATIISSEKTMPDICRVDEAIAGRIMEMCDPISVGKNPSKNYRMKKLSVKEN